MFENKLNYKLLNLLILVSIVFLLYFIKDLWMGIVTSIFNVVAPFILAFAIAYVIHPLVRKLVDAGAPKWLAILIVCILGIGLLLIVLLLTIPLIYEQSLLFLSNISVLLSELSTKYEINFGSLQSTLSNLSSNLISNLGSSISNGAIGVFNSSINVVSSSIVVLCAAVYFLIDMQKSRKTKLYLIKLDEELTKYIIGMGTNVLVQGIEYTVAFLLIGHPNFLILGLLSGISAIIPYFGGFVVAVVSLLVSSVISTKLFILTVIISVICPILDGNVIGPKIYGKTNKLHPLVVIFAVSAGGVLAGFWGIVISLPIAILFKTTYSFYSNDINTKLKGIKNK